MFCKKIIFNACVSCDITNRATSLTPFNISIPLELILKRSEPPVANFKVSAVPLYIPVFPSPLKL